MLRVWSVCHVGTIRASQRRKDAMFELNCMEIDRNNVGGLLISRPMLRDSQAVGPEDGWMKQRTDLSSSAVVSVRVK